MAGLALDGVRALGGATALAGFALAELGHIDLDGRPEHSLIQVQLEFVTQVGAAEYLRATATTATAEDVTEHVAEDIAETFARIEAGTTACATLGVESFVP